MLRYLEITRKEWTPYSQVVRTALKQDTIGEADLVVISERSESVLKKMDTTVRRMTRTYGKKAGIREDARAINWAGAQRMLTQRMAKDLCFIAAGVGVEAARFGLGTNATLFQERLAILRNGDAAQKVAAPVNADVRRHLDEVDAGWSAIAPQIMEIAAQTMPDKATLAALVAELDRLLRASHQAVQAMEQVES